MSDAKVLSHYVALDIYNVLFNDNQNKLKNQRTTLFILKKHGSADLSQKDIIERGMHSLDVMLDDLVNATYSLAKDHLMGIEQLADVGGVYSPELEQTLKEITKRYTLLQHQELAYQKFANVNYVNSKNEIEHSTMNLLEIKTEN